MELFFKWIKQHLKVKSFVGGSMNAVRTQLWIALCAYLLVAFIKFRSRLGQSILQILRLVQLNLFERRDLDELFCPEKQKIPLHNNQLSLFQIYWDSSADYDILAMSKDSETMKDIY